MRWVLVVLLAWGYAGVARAEPAALPDQPPAWCIQIDWPRDELTGLSEPPDPDSLTAPSILMLRNEYDGRGGFPLGGIALKATFQIQEEAGHIAIGVIDLPAHFEGEGHVLELGRPVVYREVHHDAMPSWRQSVQILENHAYYRDDAGLYLCRSFITGEVDTLSFRGTLLEYSPDRLHVLVMTGSAETRGLAFSYYNISSPPEPRLQWTKDFRHALGGQAWASISPTGDLVAIQYVDFGLELVVFDADGEVRLHHTHGPDERAGFGVTFVSPTDLLEGFDPQASFQLTEELSLYRIKSGPPRPTSPGPG